MGDHARHAAACPNRVLGRRHNDMACLDRDISVDVDVSIHHQHIAHLAHAQIMAAAHPRGCRNGGADRLRFLIIGRLVHQIMQLPSEGPAHFRDHQTDDQCCDGIRDRIAHEVADNAAPAT